MSKLYLNSGNLISWNLEPQIHYRYEFLNIKLNIMGGTTFQSRERNQNTLYATGFPNNNLINNVAAATNITSMGANNSQYRYHAFFGRINFSYHNKYILNLTGRRDGSSRFGPGNRFSNFGAIGAAWIFSKENIVEEKFSWLNYGKLRGSYGITGSDLIGDYKYLSTYNLTGNNYNGITALEPTQLFNPNFSWESNKKIEGA